MRWITLFSTASQHFGIKEIWISSQNYINESFQVFIIEFIWATCFLKHCEWKQGSPRPCRVPLAIKDAQKDQKWMLPRKSPMCTSVLIKGNRFLCLPILPSLVIIVLFFLAVLWDMWDLSSPTSQPEIDSAPPTVKAQNLNCWISREVPILPSLVMPNSARELCTCSHNSDMSKFPPFIRIPGDEGPL